MVLKDDVIKMIKHMPKSSTIDDVMYGLYFKQKVDKGLKDLEKNDLIDDNSLQKELKKWLRK